MGSWRAPVVRSVTGKKCVVRYGDKTTELSMKLGERRKIQF